MCMYNVYVELVSFIEFIQRKALLSNKYTRINISGSCVVDVDEEISLHCGAGLS